MHVLVIPVGSVDRVLYPVFAPVCKQHTGFFALPLRSNDSQHTLHVIEASESIPSDWQSSSIKSTPNDWQSNPGPKILTNHGLHVFGESAIEKVHGESAIDSMHVLVIPVGSVESMLDCLTAGLSKISDTANTD